MVWVSGVSFLLRLSVCTGQGGLCQGKNLRALGNFARRKRRYFECGFGI